MFHSGKAVYKFRYIFKISFSFIIYEENLKKIIHFELLTNRSKLKINRNFFDCKFIDLSEMSGFLTF